MLVNGKIGTRNNNDSVSSSSSTTNCSAANATDTSTTTTRTKSLISISRRHFKLVVILMMIFIVVIAQMVFSPTVPLYHANYHNMVATAVFGTSPTSKRTSIRNVTLLLINELTKNHDIDNAYSGMWWVNRNEFMDHWVKTFYCVNLEGATFKLYNQIYSNNIYMTKDWLDFNVEHLSHYYKGAADRTQYLSSITTINNYMNSVTKPFKQFTQSKVEDVTDVHKKEKNFGDFKNEDDNEIIESAFHYTLAVLPMHFKSSNDIDCNINRFIQNLSINAVDDNDIKQCASIYSASATIVSLWQAGIRRVVIAGNIQTTNSSNPDNDEDDIVPPIVQTIIDLFRDSSNSNSDNRFSTKRDTSNTKVVYVYVPKDGNAGVPCTVLDRLHSALNHSLPEAEQLLWLGTNEDNYHHQDGEAAVATTTTAAAAGTGIDDDTPWRYIYFSEPDLILHTRPEAISTLSRTLNDGNLIAAHRLQLLRHESMDYPSTYKSDNNNKLFNNHLPNYGIFTNFTDLNEHEGDACCDAGPWWPGRDKYPKCGNFWYYCGFPGKYDENTSVEDIYDNHKRLFLYPNVRLTSGTNVRFVPENGRVCIPKKGGTCD